MVKGIFFDFNGTLYFDGIANRDTWEETINKITNNSIDFNDFYTKGDFSMDINIISAAYRAINNEFNKKDIEYWTNYKEERYKQYGIDHNMISLPPGTKKMMDYIKSKNIPIILCTRSIKGNVDYYYKYFGLSNGLIKK